MPVTCMEAFVEFKSPPRETFNEIVPVRSSHMRMRVSPDISIGLGRAGESSGRAHGGSRMLS